MKKVSHQTENRAKNCNKMLLHRLATIDVLNHVLMNSKSCLDELLVILQRNGCVLPRDARALLKIPTSVETKTMLCGSYFYLGIAAGLRRILGEDIS